MMSWMRLGLPLLILIALAFLLARGLQYDPRNLPSAKIGKPAPALLLPLLGESQQTFDMLSMRGQVWVLNVFASWCAACVTEHPSLLQLASRKGVLLVGLAYKDNPADTQAWLKRYGNPYRAVALDTDGRMGIDYGVYGVPETYIIDRHGIIRYRHVGPIKNDFFDQQLVPLLTEISIEKQIP